MKFLSVLVIVLAASGCVGAQVTRLSQNTMLIDAGAAPACGPGGAAKVAAKSAAIETIRADFDRYVIAGTQSQNNVSVSQMPGQVVTSGSFGGGTFNATSRYVPGATIVRGSHDRSLMVVMFRNGEPGSENALDARQSLGPDWAETVKAGVRTCL